MTRTLILTYNYSSISNVASDIAEVLRNNGEIVTISSNPFFKGEFDKLVIFMPFNPPMLNNYLLRYKYFNGKKYFYTTVDGIPNLEIVNKYLLNGITFIPNSKFSAENLQEVNLQTDLPVFHGVNFRIVKNANDLAQQLTKKLNEDFPDAKKFGIVSGMTKRKNIELLIQSFNLLNSKFPDQAKNIHFFVISHKNFKDLDVPQNVHFVAEFGYNPREYIFAFYKSMDYIIDASGCEGFGLPVLESMAMGTPVIHQLMPPFDEFTSWQWNLLFKSSTVENYYDRQHGQRWKIHKFEPIDLVSTIILASNLQDRDERSKNLQELAKNYDINKLYVRFLE